MKLTHEFIAEMIGVRRAGVTEVSGRFEREGIISQKRGHTHIVDGPRLESASCECYLVVKDEYDRLLGRTLGAEKPPAGTDARH